MTTNDNILCIIYLLSPWNPACVTVKDRTLYTQYTPDSSSLSPLTISHRIHLGVRMTRWLSISPIHGQRVDIHRVHKAVECHSLWYSLYLHSVTLSLYFAPWHSYHFTLHFTDNTLPDRVHDHDTIHHNVHENPLSNIPSFHPLESSSSTDTPQSAFTVDADALITDPESMAFPETVFMPLIDKPASSTMTVPSPETQHSQHLGISS